MKIVKKSLKFDMVLDGEKINSLEDLREHPSTELLDLQQDGRLSRWLRVHGGANEADQLSALSLSGNKAQDLHAICQVIGIDIDLEDIVETLKEEDKKQDKIKESSDTEIETNFPAIIGNPKIDEWRNVLLDNLRCAYDVGKKGYYPSRNKILTNIECFSQEEGCIFVNNTELIELEEYISPQCVALNSENITLKYSTEVKSNDYAPRRAFIKGKDVIIRLNTPYHIDFICVVAKKYIYRYNTS